MVMMLAGLLLVAAPAGAQLDYQFQSTGSSYMNTGSSYSSSPTIGANGMAEAPSATAPSQVSGRRNVGNPPDTPIGDAVLPLLLFTVLAAAAVRKKKGASA